MLAHRLSRHPALASLGPEQLGKMSASARRIRFRAGRKIVKGEEGGMMSVLIEGAVWERLRSDNPDQVGPVVRLIAAPAILADTHLLANEVGTIVESVTPSEVIRVPRHFFDIIMLNRPSYCRRLMRDLADRLHLIAEQQRALMTTSTEVRMAGFLADHFAVLGDDNEQTNEIELAVRLSQAKIACALGVCRATVNKIEGDWRRSGILRRHRGRFSTVDIGQLEAIAGGLSHRLISHR